MSSVATIRRHAAAWLEAKLGRKSLSESEAGLELAGERAMLKAGIRSIDVTRTNGETFTITRIAPSGTVVDHAGIRAELTAAQRKRVFPIVTVPATSTEQFNRQALDELVTAGRLPADIIARHTTHPPRKVYLQETLKQPAPTPT